AWEHTLGYTSNEISEKPWLDFIHPDDREATVAEAEKLSAGDYSLMRFANRYRCKNGSYKWLSWTAMPSFEEQVIYATARDITEVRRAEETLKENELRHRSVFAALEEGILVVDMA